MIVHYENARELPFVSVDGEGSIESLWNVKPSGNWAADCALGRAHGEQLVRYIRQTGDHGILAFIAQSMDPEEPNRGVDVGMLTAVSIGLVQ